MKCIFGEENQQFQYSVAGRATKPIGGGGITSYLDTGVFTATNDDEAKGIAYRLLHQRFPIAEGYGDHQFFTIRTEELTDHVVRLTNSIAAIRDAFVGPCCTVMMGSLLTSTPAEPSSKQQSATCKAKGTQKRR